MVTGIPTDISMLPCYQRLLVPMLLITDLGGYVDLVVRTGSSLEGVFLKILLTDFYLFMIVFSSLFYPTAGGYLVTRCFSSQLISSIIFA